MSDRPRWLTDPARSGVEAGAGSRRDAGSDPAPTRRPVAGGRRLRPRPRRAHGEGTRSPGPPSATRAPKAPKALSSSRARFERRAAQVRRRPWRLVGVALGVVAVVAALVWAVGFSPLLAARAVSVTGLADPTEQQGVMTAAHITLGTPLARVDTSASAARVGRIPTVASVTVSRSWPSTIVVSVQRKVPVLAVKNPQGQLQVVDATGVAYETVDTVPTGVAQVKAATEAPDPAGIRVAIGILQVLPPAMRSQVSEVTVTSADLVTLELGAVSVVWGGPEDGPKKLAVLQALLPTTPGVIDVSAPETPVTR
jgi:cell division protein FtsQ